MVRILPPLKPDLPAAGPGMRIAVAPSPHSFFLEDYEYYDQMGRDPLQQNFIWGIPDDEERVTKLKKLLDEEYPKQMHRRKILLKAADRGDEAIVRCLVEMGVKVQPDWQKIEQEEKEKEKNGEDSDKDADNVSLPDKEDPSVLPMHAACTFGRLGCVKIFVESGVDVNVPDEMGRTPLIAAAAGSNTEIIKYLVEQGADPTARTYADKDLTKEYLETFAGCDALEMVAGYGNVEAIKLLLEHPFHGSRRKRKMRGNEPTESGVFVTPFALKGAAGGSFEALKLMLERGAFPMEDKDGKTKSELLSEEERRAIVDATSTCVEHGDLPSLKLLLSYQYPVDKDGRVLPFEVPEKWHKYWTYGAYKAVGGNRPDKFEYLHSFGIKEHGEMSLDGLPEGQTLHIQHLLETAVKGGSTDCVKLLIEKYGADPTKARKPPGPSTQPLYAAASCDKPEVVRYLLENHTKIDIHKGSGRFAAGPTPLWIAIVLKSLESVELLLKHGGPVEHVDEEIKHPQEKMIVVLTAITGDRSPVYLETEDHAKEKKHLRDADTDQNHLNPSKVRVELEPEDREWLAKLQLRKSDEQLREHGVGARELNQTEGAKLGDLPKDDVRRMLADYPTNSAREESLREDDDLVPEWRPAFV